MLPGRPDGLVLPKAEGAASVAALVAKIGNAPAPPILPIATETPAAIFQLGGYGAARQQLAGLTWGAEDLSAAIGAVTAREADGSYTAPYEMARALTLYAGGDVGGDPALPIIRCGGGQSCRPSSAARGARLAPSST